MRHPLSTTATSGAQRVIEERPGFAGARRALGGVGGHIGAPYVHGSEQPAPYVDVEETTGTELAPPWICILHNCECHTFEQVVTQLQKAIACSEEEGWEIAWRVHNTGKAVVKVAPEAECVRVGNILASIGLVVTVVQS